MHIFIDETGSFSLAQFPSPSLVGALIVPDANLARLEKSYSKIRKNLPKVRGEVKGRLLDEQHVDQIADLIRKAESLFEVKGIELGTHTEDGVRHHQNQSAEGMTRNLTEAHHEKLKEQALALRRELEALSVPLYVQTQLTFELIRDIIELAPMYYSQRRPKELAAFHWIIDAKGTDNKPTSWEQWWSKVILPRLQSNTIRNPIAMFDRGDYSYMNRFNAKTDDWLRELIGPKTDKEAPSQDLRLLVIESLRFSSDTEPGLEMVDILTNATRRALVGNLQEAGWSNIPKLIINDKRRPHGISLASLEDDVVRGRQYPYRDVLEKFGRTGRDMLTPSHRNSKD